MSGIVHFIPCSAMAMRSQVSGRSLRMEGSISELWALHGALNYYEMEIGLPNIAIGSRLQVPTIDGLQTVG